MTIFESDLRQFTGTENWYRHGFVRNVLYTDGAKYVAEEAQAYWLLDLIATSQLEKVGGNKTVAAEGFQTWVLKVDGGKAVLTCDDGNGNVVFTREIEFTDFPAESVTLWCCDGGPGGCKVIMLPSEY